MASDPRPMDPARLTRLRTMFADGWMVPGERGRELMTELLAHVEWQAREVERERDRAEMLKARCARYERVMAALPVECWPEYDGAEAVAGLVDSAARTAAAEAEIARLRTRVAEALGLDHATPWDELFESIPMMLAEERQRGFADGEAEVEARTDAEDQRVADDLLAARAGWRGAMAEIARLRSRVRVEAEDVAGKVRREHVAAWLERSDRWSRVANGVGLGPAWENVETGDCIIPRAGDDHIAFAIGSIARCDNRNPWRILDEMAAMPAEGEGE